MDEYRVDIYQEPGITLRAGPVLELAERHGVRGTVELLLPYTVMGPGYVRGVFEELRTALRMLKAGRIDEGVHWIGEAVRCVPTSMRTVHHPSEQPGTLPAATDAVTGAANQDTGADPRGTPTSTVHTTGVDGADTTPADNTQPPLIDIAQAPHGEMMPAVEAHVYPAEVARSMARSTASATYIQPEPGTEFRGMHLIGAATGPEARWRDVLYTGADTGTVTAVAVSDPRQVRPENRLDDQHWQRAARHVANTLDPHIWWVAFRTRPDAIVLFVASAPKPGTLASPRLAAAAATALHQPDQTPARPPIAGKPGTGSSPTHRVDTPRPPAAPSLGRTPGPRR